MSRGLNQVMLIGNLGNDPELRCTSDGTRVATLSLATNFTYKAQNGDKITKTEWHRVVAWRGLAEIAEKYLRKGSKLFVQGRIQYSKYTDREGVERYSTEIVASEITMLDGAPQGATAGSVVSDGGPVEGFVPIDQR